MQQSIIFLIVFIMVLLASQLLLYHLAPYYYTANSNDLCVGLDILEGKGKVLFYSMTVDGNGNAGMSLPSPSPTPISRDAAEGCRVAMQLHRVYICNQGPFRK